jgi:hypothetical protein
MVNELFNAQTWIIQNFKSFAINKKNENGLVNLIMTIRSFCSSVPEYDKGKRKKNNHMFVVMVILSFITNTSEYREQIMMSQKNFAARYPFFNQYDEPMKYKLLKYANICKVLSIFMDANTNLKYVLAVSTRFVEGTYITRVMGSGMLTESRIIYYLIHLIFGANTNNKIIFDKIFHKNPVTIGNGMEEDDVEVDLEEDVEEVDVEEEDVDENDYLHYHISKNILMKSLPNFPLFEGDLGLY